MTRIETTAQVRQDLVAAAVELLAEEGMRGVTHRRIEQRAGVSQGTVKYHYGSLEGLVTAVVEHMVDVEVASVLVVPPELVTSALESGETPDEVWHRADAVVSEILGRPHLVRARFELYLHAATRPELQEVIGRGREQFVAKAADSLQEVVGTDDSRDAESAARMVLALVDGALLHHLSAPRPDQGTVLAEWLIGASMAAGGLRVLAAQHRSAVNPVG